MRIFGISDLHLERCFDISKFFHAIPWPKADTLLLAGDIGYPRQPKYSQFLDLCRRQYRHVLFVAGNHEFYLSKCQYDHEVSHMRNVAKDTQTHFLHRDSVQIEHVLFHGCTLFSWLDQSYRTSDIGRVFKTREEYRAAHVNDVKWLQAAIQPMGTQVILTHHMPSTHLIHPRYRDRNSSAHATNILELLNLTNVPLWLCGHTHERQSVQWERTKLMTNPVGSPSEQRLRSSRLSSEIENI